MNNVGEKILKFFFSTQSLLQGGFQIGKCCRKSTRISEMPKFMNICWCVGYKKVLQSLDVCLVKNGKDVLLMFPALLAIISFEVTFWEVLMMLFDQPKSVISFEVTFREVLTMLAVFDCIFIRFDCLSSFFASV